MLHSWHSWIWALVVLSCQSQGYQACEFKTRKWAVFSFIFPCLCLMLSYYCHPTNTICLFFYFLPIFFLWFAMACLFTVTCANLVCSLPGFCCSGASYCLCLSLWWSDCSYTYKKLCLVMPSQCYKICSYHCLLHLYSGLMQANVVLVSTFIIYMHNRSLHWLQCG